MAAARHHGGLLSVAAFAPTDLPNIVLWVRPEELSALADGDPITTWTHAPGTSNDLAQSDASQKPLCKTGLQNGYRGARFDGSNDRFDVGTPWNAGPFTCLMVTKMADNGNNRGPWLGNSSGASAASGVFGNDADRYFLYNMASSINDSAPQTNTIVEVYASTTNAEVLENGGSVGTKTGTFGSPVNRIGRNGFLLRHYYGDLIELIVYSDEKSSGDRTLVRNYLNAKYAIY